MHGMHESYYEFSSPDNSENNGIQCIDKLIFKNYCNKRQDCTKRQATL